MTDSPQAPEPPDASRETTEKAEPEEHPLTGLLRAFRRFLLPFLLSWAFAYVGANLELDWLYFVGLGGVGVSMLVFLIWLIS